MHPFIRSQFCGFFDSMKRVFCLCHRHGTRALMHDMRCNLKVGCIAFQSGCNEQVFSSKSWKKIWRRSVLSFSKKKKRKNPTI